MRTLLKTESECMDFARGACLFGAGGGGLSEIGLDLLRADLTANRQLAWVDLEDLEDDALTCCAWGMGSIAPKDKVWLESEMRRLDIRDVVAGRHMAIAVRELERFTGQKIDVIIPFEPGGRVSTTVLSTAASLGIPILNGDYSGRAVPEVTQIAPGIMGETACPVISIDIFGNVVIIDRASNTHMVERLGKHLAMASYGSVAMAGFLLPAARVKNLVVPGVARASLTVGKAIRVAREAGENPVQAAAQTTDGRILFKGILTGKDWEDKNGYMCGNNHITGIDEFQDQHLRIWFKNENHIAWINGLPLLTSPDLICVMETCSGEPLTNSDPRLETGCPVSVLGIPAPSLWHSPKALKAIEPRWFGFDMDPISLAREAL